MPSIYYSCDIKFPLLIVSFLFQVSGSGVQDCYMVPAPLASKQVSCCGVQDCYM